MAKEKKTKEQKKKERKGIFKEFIAFINKGNAMALAIGVIIGAAFGAIVTAINVNIISPLIAWLIGDTDLKDSLITTLKEAEIDGDTVVKAAIEIKWGAFLQAVVDFLLIALILFIISKIVGAVVRRVNRLAEEAKKKLEAKKAEEEKPQEVVEPEPAPEPVVDPNTELLKEIRDLLKESKEAK
ncbi:MAG: large conductance mechanosensitive channel protein MscL [Bacilli bacterium]|nr:large conductance mechanosensitive channel protein MscL [Bacilli bacterium]